MGRTLLIGCAGLVALALGLGCGLGCGARLPDKADLNKGPDGVVVPGGGNGGAGAEAGQGGSGGQAGNGATGGQAGGGGASGASGGGGAGSTGGAGASGGASGGGGAAGGGGSANTSGTGSAGGGGLVPRGSYSYERIMTLGFGEATAVAFHPSGDYAVILERFDDVWVYDWATQTATRFDLRPAQGNIYWEDVSFHPDGGHALLVGNRRWGGSAEGQVYRFDDANWREGLAVAAVVESLAAATGAASLVAVAHPGDGAPPWVLRKNGPGPYSATVRALEPSTGAWLGGGTTQGTTAGCEDLAIARDGWGAPAALIVCGENGGDTWILSDPTGEALWSPGGGNLGNTSRVAGSADGAYALAVSWSGPAAYRFESGAFTADNAAPDLGSREVWGAGLQPDGTRALLVGRGGAVVEVRGGGFVCDSLGYDPCDLTDVSVPGFESAPFNADANTYLYDVAFRPGCDGGLIVGGKGTLGQLVEVTLNGGRACR